MQVMAAGSCHLSSVRSCSFQWGARGSPVCWGVSPLQCQKPLLSVRALRVTCVLGPPAAYLQHGLRPAPDPVNWKGTRTRRGPFIPFTRLPKPALSQSLLVPINVISIHHLACDTSSLPHLSWPPAFPPHPTCLPTILPPLLSGVGSYSGTFHSSVTHHSQVKRPCWLCSPL